MPLPSGTGFTRSAINTILNNKPSAAANAIADTKTTAAQLYNAQQAWNQMNYQTQSAQEAMRFNAEQAQINRDWQERMSNTAYQRAVTDMKKAGLNPILAFQNGGASTPSGATAQGYAMSGAAGQTSAAQTFKGDWGEAMLGIIGVLAMSAMGAMENNRNNNKLNFLNQLKAMWNDAKAKTKREGARG